MKCSATECAWFPIFLLNALVKRVKRRIDIRRVGFRRSTHDVEISLLSGLPSMTLRLMPTHSGGLWRRSLPSPSAFNP